MYGVDTIGMQFVHHILWHVAHFQYNGQTLTNASCILQSIHQFRMWLLQYRSYSLANTLRFINFKNSSKIHYLHLYYRSILSSVEGSQIGHIFKNINFTYKTHTKNLFKLMFSFHLYIKIPLEIWNCVLYELYLIPLLRILLIFIFLHYSYVLHYHDF